MDQATDEEDPRHWLLSAHERGNSATAIDHRTPDGTAFSRGNRVHALVDGEEYFRRLRAELADTGAGDQIYLTAWIGDPTERLGGPDTSVGGEFTRALRAGAGVYALFWCPYLSAGKNFVRENRRFVTLLRSLGGAAVLDQRVRALGSHHQKFLVIRRPERPETDVAFLGGIDPFPTRGDDHTHHGDPQVQPAIARVYGRRPAWHDAHLQVRGPAVADIEHCFRERWDDSTSLRRVPFRWLYRKLLAGEESTTELPAPLPDPAPYGSHTVQLLRTYPKKTPPYPFAPAGEYSVARGYMKALRNAREFVYVEDQFLWSPMVAEVLAQALRREPGLRIVAVAPRRPNKDGLVQVNTSDVAHRKALDLLYAAGGDRVDVHELAHPDGLPIYVHSKVCVIDDVWATVGSANLNRRSWTYDSELTAAVMDESNAANRFARNLRLRLWREHLGRDENDDADLLDPAQGADVLRRAAMALEQWRHSDRSAPPPPGHLRTHPRPATAPFTKLWAVPAGRLLTDPDGRPRPLRRQRHW